MLKVHTLSREVVNVSKFRDHCFIYLTAECFLRIIFFRQKLGSSQSESILIQSLQNGIALEFERSDSTRRLRLVLSELLFISSQVYGEFKIRNIYIPANFITTLKAGVTDLWNLIICLIYLYLIFCTLLPLMSHSV